MSKRLWLSWSALRKKYRPRAGSAPKRSKSSTPSCGDSETSGASNRFGPRRRRCPRRLGSQTAARRRRRSFPSSGNRSRRRNRSHPPRPRCERRRSFVRAEPLTIHAFAGRSPSLPSSRSRCSYCDRGGAPRRQRHRHHHRPRHQPRQRAHPRRLHLRRRQRMLQPPLPTRRRARSISNSSRSVRCGRA